MTKHLLKYLVVTTIMATGFTVVIYNFFKFLDKADPDIFWE